ncbi:hypothetical protein QCN27_07550 [Cereibacter sp. SYSU M97828]|nr:hypothetical protein [Cereibacter flavus]
MNLVASPLQEQLTIQGRDYLNQTAFIDPTSTDAPVAMDEGFHRASHLLEWFYRASVAVGLIACAALIPQGASLRHKSHLLMAAIYGFVAIALFGGVGRMGWPEFFACLLVGAIASALLIAARERQGPAVPM